MVRSSILMLCLIWCAGVVAPTTSPSQLTTDELYRQAIEQMRSSSYADARELFDQICKVVPVDKRTREMVVNRAISDMAIEAYVMRAVRELSLYLIDHPQEDEPATNVLAGALNLAASEPRLKRGAIWQKAYAEWDRRNAILDQSRPGFHRWGARWINDEEYAAIRQYRREVELAIREQEKRVEQARRQITAVQARRFDGAGPTAPPDDPFAAQPIRPLDMTTAEVAEYEELRKTDHQKAWRYYNDFQSRRRRDLDRQFTREDYLASMRELRQDRADRTFERELREQISDAEMRVAVELYELRVIAQQRPRPVWPTKFEPVGP